MKHLTLFVASILFLNICRAQTTFQPGWYIVQNKASYAVIQASSADIDAFGGKLKDVDLNQLEMNAGETVLAFDRSGDKTYCFDPLGRMLVFSGEGSLNKGKIGEIATVGRMLAKIEILSGNDVAENSFVWIVGQDVAKNTLSIQVQGDKIIEISQDKIQIIGKMIREIAKSFELRSVNN